MMMPGRKYQAGSDYRYGFNGKEKDNETTGTTTYDYGFRIYNPALGRFLSVDPLTKSYPWNSTYAFAENDVIRSIDLDGLEKYIVIFRHDKYGRATSIALSGINKNDVGAINMRLVNVANNKTLTKEDVYETHYRRNTLIAKGERKGGLTNTEASIYNNASTSNEGGNDAFDKDFGMAEQENNDELLGRSYGIGNSVYASKIKGSNPDGYRYFDGQDNLNNVAPRLSGVKAIGATDYSRGGNTSATPSTSLPSLNINETITGISADITSIGKSFLNSNGLNVGFAESITLTIADNTSHGQWQQVANGLTAKFGSNVKIVIDSKLPTKFGKAQGTPFPTLVNVSASYSGANVSNGNSQYSQNGAIK